VGTTTIEQSEYVSRLITDITPHVQYFSGKVERFFKVLDSANLSALKTALTPFFATPEQMTLKAWQGIIQPYREAMEKSYDTHTWLTNMEGTVTAIATIQAGIPHHVLNAKHHAQEANIVAQAGRRGAVTIATNMAGRGTDILLGGNPQVLLQQEMAEAGIEVSSLSEEAYTQRLSEKKAITEAEKTSVMEHGGLFIIGTERHESRRIDNQLRGRAGRQGDPGTTLFFLSLEDSLLKLFPSQMVVQAMTVMNFEESIPLSDKLLSRSLEVAQKKVEAYHFDMRKNVLQYDDVLTEQRKLIYSQRKQVLKGEKLRESMLHMIQRTMARSVSSAITPEFVPGGQDAETQAQLEVIYQNAVDAIPPIRTKVASSSELAGRSYQELISTFEVAGTALYHDMEEQLNGVMEQLKRDHGIQLNGEDANQRAILAEQGLSEAEITERFHPLRGMERDLTLRTVDSKWVDYLHNLDILREGIGLRAYGQKDPLIEYKREAFELFQKLMLEIQTDIVRLFFRSQIQIDIPRPENFNEEAFLAQHQQVDSIQDLSQKTIHDEPHLPPLEGDAPLSAVAELKSVQVLEAESEEASKGF
jgi:preprotein translocase subunit SecA